jgi:BirA family biotin operon repressor/biotin-[acetyl-CoA-carboxylase] ligase
MTFHFDLDAADLQQQLTAKSFVRTILHLAEVASTQDIVRAAAVNGERAGLVVIADHQHAGRGQFGRIWCDIPGQTLLCSFLLRPTPADTPAILMHFAQTLCGVIGRAIPEYSVHLKHPNDIVVDTPTGTKKLAGVIAEGAVQSGGQQWMSVGFGVNIGAAPSGMVDGVNLANSSTYINQWARTPQTRQSLLRALFEQYIP